MNKKWQIALIWLLGIGVIALIICVGMKDSIYRKAYGENESWSSILTSSELIKTDIENVYYVNEKITKIKGETDYSDEPNVIEYRITTVYDYEVVVGEADYKPQWSLKIEGLAFGVNYLTITFRYPEENQNQEFNYVIYNYNEANADSLAMNDLDSDSDGLTDYFELTNSETDPYNIDSDGNGINDGDEDPDNDGLNNIKEQEYGSLANSMDSDGDGLLDGEELNYKTNLLIADTDGDGFSDYIEIQMGTDPNDKKSPGKSDAISYEEKTEFNSGMTVEISMVTTPTHIESFEIYEIPKSFALSSENITGMIGTGISIVMDGEPEEAEINIVLDCDDYVDGEDYYLYYFNEETYEAEFVKEQSQSGNIITAKLNHFSKYFVSSVNEEEAEQGVFSDYGIDLITTESKEALFESYEDYLSAMYMDCSVFSINICAGNIDEAQAVNNGLKTGHSWTSYYYAGDSSSLEITNIDGDASPDLTFGAIGFGGWINGYGFPEYLWKSWDGSMKLPSGYRELYYDGRTDEDGNVYYQSATFSYEEGGMSPENMNGAFISMPFVIDENNLLLIAEYVNSYKEKYDLNKNNCTTFARDLLNYAQIENSIVIDFTEEGFSVGNAYVGSAGSPGQASYSIQQNYPNEHVYVVEEILEDGSSKLWFTSKMAQECAIKTEEEQPEEGKKPIIPDVEEIVDDEVEKQKQKMEEWLAKKLEEWLEEWLAENCGGC